MSKNSEVTKMVESVETVFETVHSIILKMNDGDRITVANLTKEVAQLVSMDPKKVTPYIALYVPMAEKYSIGFTSRGKNGGFTKGKRA